LNSLIGIENLINLNYLYCYNNFLTSLEEIQNLTNLQILWCYNNFITSLREIENFTQLICLYCKNNQLTLLECIEIFIKLIKNNNNITKELQYDVIDYDDSDDFIELTNIFNNLLMCDNENEFNKDLNNIEKIIAYHKNSFQKFILK
jgi:Leucine-rich repeat (LRR) protein